MNAPTIDESPWREIYPEAQTFFNSISKKLPSYDGFKILNGPPIVHTPCLFIGYQPGGSSDDSEQKELRKSEEHWPATCEYATNKKWILAKRLQKVFEKEYLEQCVGTNAIFLRYKTIDDYKNDVDELRADIEEFCFPRVEQVIEAIDPLKIVVIGLRTLELKLFRESETEVDLKDDDGHPLTAFGKIVGRPFIAARHFSSPYITNPDRARMNDRILAWVIKT
jgi:hypothetical protein